MGFQLHDISETAFITLYCHALDAQSVTPILNDRSASKVVKQFYDTFAQSKKDLDRFERLAKKSVNKLLVSYICLRAKKFDTYTRNFAAKHGKTAVVINLGCGLDNRFERIDNGEVTFYDLDLPEIIHVKKKLFEEQQQYHFIAQSVLDHSWMDKIPKTKVLFLAEGLLMYLPPGEVKKLVLKLQAKFTDSELVAEVFDSNWLKGWKKRIVQFKLQRQLKLGPDASFQFGIPDSNELEKWNKGLKLLGDWSFLDASDGRLGAIRLFKNISFIRKFIWTVHYKIN